MTVKGLVIATIIFAWIAPSEERGLFCYTCFKARNPDLCHADTQCELEKNDQLCGTRRYMDIYGHTTYEKGCVPKVMCPNSRNIAQFSPVGRRRRRQAIDVIQCCDTDYCNKDHFKPALTTPVPDVSTGSCQSKDVEHCTVWANAMKLDICNEQIVANHLCRHFCGRCGVEVTTDQREVCIDDPICPVLSKTFSICSDEKTAVKLCPQTCKRCGDFLPSTSSMPSEKMTTVKSMLTSQTAGTNESTACKDLLSRYNEKIICSDKLISKLCPITCNTSGTVQSSMNSTDMPTSGGATSDGTTTVSNRITPITGIPNFSGNGSSNNSSGITKTNNNTSPTTSTTSLPVKTHPHCRDLDPNCPYLQKSVNICSNAEVALDIGCHLTCGYCSNHFPCADLDGSTKYCQYESRDVVCYDEQSVIKSQCYATCGRCNLFCDINPLLCQPIKTSTPPGDKACKDHDTQHYCKDINIDVDCFNEQHIITSGCFSTCHRCDLDPNSGVTLPVVTMDSTVALVTKEPGNFQTIPSGDKSCLDHENQHMHYCHLLDKDIVCENELYIKSYGCFSTCSRCDLLNSPTTTNSELSTSLETTTIKDEATSESSTTNELSTTEEWSTTDAEISTTDEVSTTDDVSTTEEVSTTGEVSTTDELSTTAEATTESISTTEETTLEATTEQTTESMTTTVEQTTTAEQTTTVDPFAACKGPISKNTGQFYLMRNNGFLSFMSTFKLHLSSSKVKWLVIYNPDIGLCQNISIFNTSQVIDIPSEFKVTRNEIEKKGVHILTSSKTDLYALYKDTITNEGFFVLPKEKLSTSYVIPSFVPSGGGESFIGIVATSVDTDVNITLKLLDKTETIRYNNTKYGDGDTISILLPERGTLELSSNTDLTGTIVKSNKDIGVQSGVDGAKVPVNSGLMNQLLEMVPPVKELGTSFFIPPLFENKQFILRLIAAHPNTSITLLGKHFKQATKVVDKIGGYIDINSNDSIKVESDKPIMAVYYQQGETKPVVPFMVIIKPEGKLGGVQEFTIPNDGLRHHILITTKSTEYPFLQIDGKGFIYRNPHVYDTQSLNSSYVVARTDISPGHHTIGSSVPSFIKVKPGIIIYADSDNDIGYGYPV
ncbi:serine-rich adhesin for platelets-like [Mytilus edulis]|uniref:serine-rich adhesin for platelets-like n=1 Tax=Mytilus edulis TaxID=6550 RepID=UPI0039EEA666